jgi:uncharacterized membrane protein YidH (DUF202 family)
VPEDEAVPGLAGERTDLAWNRNALSLAVAAAAILRRVYADIDDRSVQVVVFGIIAGAALVWLGAMTWASAASRQGIEGRMVDARHLRRITAATLLLALSALVLSLLPQP